MRDIDILHDLLKKQCPQIHQKRLNSLMVATESLLDGNQLSLTQLGRNITGNVAPKHNIKRIDRLLGNLHVVKDKFAIYQWHAQYVKERQREGTVLAKKKGVYKGRKQALRMEQITELMQRAVADENKTALASEFKISQQTLYSYLKSS